MLNTSEAVGDVKSVVFCVADEHVVASDVESGYFIPLN